MTQISRRNLLKGSAVAAGAAAFAAVPLFTASAQFSSDIDVLNYALTLEHLEYAFYRDGLRGVRASDFYDMIAPSQADQIIAYLRLIEDHEKTHVDTLIAVITSLGGTPVQELRYDFGYSDAAGFAAVARALENTGVMAYDGAIALIQDASLQTAAATIATVEARHASYLNLITGNVPFPDAFDTPKTPQEILAIAGQFIVG
jgi:rubrerythrin